MRFILSFTICAIEEEIYMVNYGFISDDRVFPLSVLYMKSYDVGVLDQLKKKYYERKFLRKSYCIK